MNSKIVMSGLSIMTALTLMAGSAYAAFVSQATSTGNTFSVGNADLQIATETAGAPNTYGPSIVGFSGTGFFPGESREYRFWLKNTSASNVVLDTSASFDAVAATLGLENKLMVQISCQNTSTVVTTTSGQYSVAAWDAGSDAIGSLGQNQEARCAMTVTLPSDADVSYEGATVNFNALFNASQAPVI